MPNAFLTESEASARAALIRDSSVDYKLSLELSADLTQPTYVSTCEISFDCTRDDASTFLDLIAARVRRLEVNGVAVDPPSFGNDRLRLDHLRAGRNVVRVVADTFYNTDGVGLHRKRDELDGGVYLYTHFEPDDARRVFACFDQPELKGAVTLDVTAPSVWTVFGNGAINSRVDQGDGSSRTQFNPTPPIPTYLAAVVAGPYHVVEDTYTCIDPNTGTTRVIPLRLMARQSFASQLDQQAPWIFEATKECLDNLQKICGFSLPFEQYAQAWVPEFNSGAMENPGLVTFNESYLPAGKMSFSQRMRFYEVIAHEMVHVHGNGDIVTPKWWDALPLNESFATFNAFLLLSMSRDFSAQAWTVFAQTEKMLALEQDQYPTTHPIATSIPSTEEVGLHFDQITYAKGASVLRQLQSQVGPATFIKGLRLYYQRHWFKAATTEDFLTAMTDASGQDILAWGREWWGTSGASTLTPLLKLSGGKLDELVIRQSATGKRVLPDGRIEACDTLRSHRLNISAYDLQAGSLVHRVTVPVDVGGASTQVVDPRLVGAPAPALLVVNDGDLTYAKVRFDATSLATLREHLSEIADPLSRTVCWTALWDMTRDGELSTTEFVQLASRHLPSESENIVVERTLAQALAFANSYSAPEHRSALRSQLYTAARNALSTVLPGSDAQLIWGRTLLSAANSNAELTMLERLLSGRETISGLDFAADADLRWQALGRLASTGRAKRPLLEAEYQRDPSDVAHRRLLAVLASRPTAQAKREAWRTVMDPATNVATIRAVGQGENVGGRLVGGIQQAGQEKVLQPYIDAYFAAIPDLWSTRPAVQAKTLTTTLFPSVAESGRTLLRSSQLLSKPLPFGAWRILMERQDSLSRAQRAQQLDRRSHRDTLNSFGGLGAA